MSKQAKEPQFEEHFNKLEKFSEELQNNQLSIDELVPRMKDALESVKICKEVLKETKSQLQEIQGEFQQLQKDELE